MSRFIVLYGEPGVGKTTIGRRLAAAIGAAHVEMSELALRDYTGPPDGVLSYVRDSLWAAGDLAVVARSVPSPVSGSTIVVTGPRRAEEIELLASKCERIDILHLITPLELRASRSTRGPEHSEFRRIAERSSLEREWGLVGRLLWELRAVSVVNIGTISEVVCRVMDMIGHDTIDSGSQGSASAWTPEYEHRFILPPDWRLPGQLSALASSWNSVADEWFLPSQVAEYDLHEQWMLRGGASPIRIRVIGQEGLGEVTTIETKRIPSSSDLSISEELVLGVESAPTARSFLVGLGYVSVAQVNKSRLSVSDPPYLYCLDDYGSEGRYLEIEMEGPGSVGDSSSLAFGSFLKKIEGLQPLFEPVALRVIRRNLRNGRRSGSPEGLGAQ